MSTPTSIYCFPKEQLTNAECNICLQKMITEAWGHRIITQNNTFNHETCTQCFLTDVSRRLASTYKNRISTESARREGGVFLRNWSCPICRYELEIPHQSTPRSLSIALKRAPFEELIRQLRFLSANESSQENKKIIDSIADSNRAIFVASNFPFLSNGQDWVQLNLVNFLAEKIYQELMIMITENPEEVADEFNRRIDKEMAIDPKARLAAAKENQE